jgi:hypothetical protein
MRKIQKNKMLAKSEIKYFLNLAKLGDLIKSKPPLGGLRFNSPGLTPPWGGDSVRLSGGDNGFNRVQATKGDGHESG